VPFGKPIEIACMRCGGIFYPSLSKHKEKLGILNSTSDHLATPTNMQI